LITVAYREVVKPKAQNYANSEVQVGHGNGRKGSKSVPVKKEKDSPYAKLL
jgi:hypothetical protein